MAKKKSSKTSKRAASSEGAAIVKAEPTKRFFVEMLTRDIDLGDAILDLLDNCVDGIERSLTSEERASDRPYDGYKATITATPREFSISDNCGGIPRGIAKRYAFRFGRPREADLDDSDNATIGIYGIGMKRAIFKMGLDSSVTSQHGKEDCFVVDIPSSWVDDDNAWALEMKGCDRTGTVTSGTTVRVRRLRPGVARQFDPRESTFLQGLSKKIAQHYAKILSKGFSVRLNKNEVTPACLQLLSPGNLGRHRAGTEVIQPYTFEGVFEDGKVAVELAVGFHRAFWDGESGDRDDERQSREAAGWTVLCNDRVVVFNDKTTLTGWGTHQVPAYHNQFISIAGVVSFSSVHPELLPLNTTKRGVDASSDIYQIVLDYMCEGLKMFTSITYNWKKDPQKARGFFVDLEPQSLREIVEKTSESSNKKTLKKLKGVGTASRLSPKLPKVTERTDGVRVVYSATKGELEEAEEYLFGALGKPAGEIGRACLDEVLGTAGGTT